MAKLSLRHYIDLIGQFTDEDVKSWDHAASGWNSRISQERADRHWVANKFEIPTSHPDFGLIRFTAITHLLDLSRDMGMVLERNWGPASA